MEPSFTGRQIKMLRESRGLSLYKLSDLTEEIGGDRIAVQTINSIELGFSQNPSRRILRPIARAFGLALSSFYEGEEETAAALT